MVGYSQDEDDQRQRMLGAISGTGLGVNQVWHRYADIGGNADLFETKAYLAGALPLPIRESNTLAQAINELIDEQPPPPRVPFLEQAQPESWRAGLTHLGRWVWGVPNQSLDQKVQRKLDPDDI